MSINMYGSASHFKTNDTQYLKTKDCLYKMKKTEEAKKEQNDIKVSDEISVPHDEYINSKKSENKPSGLYCLEQDENGNCRVLFDDPKKSNHASKNENPKVKEDNPEKSEEKCIGNTNKVDREIEKLKKKKQQLEQEIRSASSDEEKLRERKKKLALVENELNQKDNDAYRRQNSSFFEIRGSLDFYVY